VNANPIIRSIRAIWSFAAAGALIGAAAIPGGYLLIWAFHRFIIDDIFTGNMPSPADMAAFCFFAGAALLTWAIILIVLLGAVVRVLSGLRQGLDLEVIRIDEFARLRVITLLPFSWPGKMYDRLSRRA
jgi:hypothetical protein